ncbi:hypothetical protein DESC_930028 [Desulfosarcina cetonica]|nr:hypothetical protein DESC_930028 [Desulfosarcina cetonica]
MSENVDLIANRNHSHKFPRIVKNRGLETEKFPEVSKKFPAPKRKT